MDINKKIALITGASTGLGAALSQALVQKGATVYGLARNAEKLQSLRSQLGDTFIPIAMDISHHATITAWIAATFSVHHYPSILVNNAGAGYFTKIDELPLEKWQEMIQTNLNGVFYLTAAIVPLMKLDQQYKHILNIGSILGKTTRSEGAAYSATKYAMQGFSESLFKELRSHHIKVTCLNPGSISTHFFEDSGILPHHHMLQATDIADFIVHILETPDNFLIDEITLRPLNPKP